MFSANIVKIHNMQKRHHGYIQKEKYEVVPLIQKHSWHPICQIKTWI